MPRKYTRKPPAQRAWEKVDRRSPHECWPYTGLTTSNGYGSVWINPGVIRTAHRVIWEDLNGPVPAGLVLDHTCHNRDDLCPGGPTCEHRRCCNPAHLDPVSLRTNTLRGKGPAAEKAAQTHCKNGHELTRDNIYTHPQRGTRMCRTCMHETARLRRLHGVGVCSIESCTAPGYSRGWCKPHYMAWWRSQR